MVPFLQYLLPIVKLIDMQFLLVRHSLLLFCQQGVNPVHSCSQSIGTYCWKYILLFIFTHIQRAKHFRVFLLPIFIIVKLKFFTFTHFVRLEGGGAGALVVCIFLGRRRRRESTFVEG